MIRIDDVLLRFFQAGRCVALVVILLGAQQRKVQGRRSHRGHGASLGDRAGGVRIGQGMAQVFARRVRVTLEDDDVFGFMRGLNHG